MQKSTGNRIRKHIKTFLDTPLGRYLIPLSLVVFLIGVPVVLYMLERRAPVSSWYNEAWEFRKSVSILYGDAGSEGSWSFRSPISVEHSGSPLTDGEVLVEIDTASLVSSSKLRSNCRDLRFAEESGESLSFLPFWIESGCNTSSTLVWVRIPNIPDGGKTIYMYYGNNDALNGQESWGGEFTLLTTGSCPAGWTRNTGFDDRFPRGFSDYGATGGSATHTHSNWSGNTSQGTSAGAASIIKQGHEYISENWIHTHSLTRSFQSSNSLPPYLDMVFCKSPQLTLNEDLIALFDSSVPSGWNRFAELDDRFPRGAETYGGTGGSSSHTHNVPSATTGGPSQTQVNPGWPRNTFNAPSVSHTHAFSATVTSSTSSLPTYTNVLFASADSSFSPLSSMIALSTEVPPIGWTRVSGLDGRFTRGAASYGGTGGSDNHTHTLSQTSAAASGSCCIPAAWDNDPDGHGYAIGNIVPMSHTHSINITTASASTLPPYRNTLFVERNESVALTSLGSEEEVDEYFGSPPDPEETYDPLSDHDLLVQVDTASLISENKIQSDCDDIRFVDSDDTTPLLYWVESGCNTSSTLIWVRVPSIVNGGKTIYMYYGNGGVSGGQEEWNGKFTMLSSASCSSGWTRNASLDNRFIRGGVSYGGTGGSASHNHGNASCSSGGPSATGQSLVGGGGYAKAPPNHTHTLTVAVNNNTNVLPPYQDVVYCESQELVFVDGLIGIFDASAPSGWARINTLDGRFPRGASSYGSTGGSATHTHSTTGQVTGTSSTSPGAGGSGGSCLFSRAHTHTTSSSTTGSGNSLPPYTSVVFAEGGVNNQIPAGLITIVSQLPPLGWERLGSLDGRFLQGAASYGSTGGSANHTHSVSITTGGPSSTGTGDCYPEAYFATNHTHSCTATTNSQANVPPYFEVIFAKRKTSSVPHVLGQETSNAPQAPTTAAAQALSTTSIRWNFIDTSTNETGFKVYDTNDVLRATCEGEDLLYCEETGLSPNTQYTRKITAYNDEGESPFSEEVSRYTLAPTPEISTGIVSLDSVDLVATGAANLTLGSSGFYFDCTGENCDAGLNEWVQIATASATGLSSNTQYEFRVKARNGDGVETAYSESSSAYTQIQVPVLGVSNLGPNSLTLTAENVINAGEGESGVMFECVGEPCGNGLGEWVGDNSVEVSSLLLNTEYTFRAKARNADGIETEYSENFTLFTGAAVPSGPMVTQLSTSSLNVVISENGNNSQVEYAIEEDSGSFVDVSTGALVEQADWGTYSQFGGSSGVDVVGLNSGTQYSFRVKARNLDEVETEYSSASSAWTALNAPTIGTPEVLSDTSIRWTFTDNEANEVGFKVYNQTGDVVVTCASADLSSCDENGLSPNAEYSRRVVAYNDGGESDFSALATARTHASVYEIGSVIASNVSAVVNIVSNDNPAHTEIALQDEDSGLYFDLEEGGLVGSPVWITLTDFSDLNSEISGLVPNTEYAVRVKARNADNVETDFSAASSFFTLANDPASPSIEAASPTQLKLVLNINGNSLSTEYSVLNVDTGDYVNKENGELQDEESWGTYLEFGLEEGIEIDGLTPNTSYEYRVKARNGDSVETPFSASSSKFTLANTVNSVAAVTSSSTTANVSFGVNSNPSYTQFAIEEVGSGNWVNKGTGVLQSGQDWGTYEQFGNGLGIGVVNLSPNTTYEFRVIARNNDDIETSFSESDVVVTHANAPSAPEVLNVSTTVLNVILDTSGNPSNTQYVVEEVGSGLFLNTSGQLVSEQVWGTYTQFGGVNGVNASNLQSGQNYEFRVKARNSENVETGYSVSSSQTTLLTAPEIGTPEVLSSTSIRWFFTDNESNEDGYRVYNEENVQVAQCIGEDLEYCDEYGLTPNTSYTRKVVAYNSQATSAASSTASAVTLANTPDAPSVSAESSTGLKVVFGANNNPVGTEFVIQEVVSGRYVNKADGRLGSAQVWGTRVEFGGDAGIVVGDLFANAQYEFVVKAKNSQSVESSNSSAVAKYTLAVTPGAPDTSPLSSSQITLVVRSAGNPPMTQYAVRETGSGKYVNKSNGSLVDGADWGTFTQFGGNSGRSVTGLQVNAAYNFVVVARNGDQVEGSPSSVSQTATLANLPKLPTVENVSFDSARISVDGNGNPVGTQVAILEQSTNRFVGTDGRLTNTETYRALPQNGIITVDVGGLIPGSVGRFVAKARNTLGVETVVTTRVDVPTRARPVNASQASAVSTNAIRLTIASVDNDPSVQYLIRETVSGLYVDKRTGTLQANESWGTVSEFGGSSGLVISGLSPARDYSFRINARNSGGIVTGFGAFAQAGTQAVLTNIPAELKVFLRDNVSLDLTQSNGGQRGLQNVRVTRNDFLVADIPILFDSNRDWSSVVIDSDPQTSRVAVKIGSEHGFSGKYMMYVPKGSTNAFVLCPNAHDLGSVSSDCTDRVLFIGPFPQTLQVKGSAVSVSIAILEGKEYWVVDGLSGTGGQGVVYSPGEEPKAPSPSPEVPNEGGSGTGTGGSQGGSSGNNSSGGGVIQTIVQAPQAVRQVIQGVQESLDRTVGQLPERELQVVTTSTSVATVTVGVAAVSGGLTQIPYYIAQLFFGVLSFFGFRKTGKPYGYVYDSVTKKPVSRAVVRIYDNGSRLVWTDVTDMFGAFNANLEPGKYKMLVRKSGYEYPSRIIVGKSDYPLEPVYKGELVTFSKKSSIKYVVPLDPKRTSRLEGFSLAAKSRILFILKQFNVLIFAVGIALALYAYNKFPTTQNLVVLVVYIPAVVLLLRSILSSSQSHGKVTERGGKPVAGVMVALKELEFDRYLGKRVTGKNGEYQFVVPKGVYQLEILNDDWMAAKFEGGSGVVEVSERTSSVIAKNIVVKRK